MINEIVRQHLISHINNRFNDLYTKLNNEREYLTNPALDNVNNLKRIFIANNSDNINQIELNLSKIDPEIKNKVLRIMTYNVHFWTNVNEEPNFFNIFQVIIEMNPDILCLNEVLFGNIKLNNTSHESINVENEFKNKGYVLVSSCNFVPSWFEQIYGIALFVKMEILEMLKMYAMNNMSGYRPQLCAQNRCDLGQLSQTLINNNGDYPRNLSIETRCFIKISLPMYDLILVHLEPYHKDIRKLQLQQIIESIDRPSVLLGDLNIINHSDYIINDNSYEYLKLLLNKKRPNVGGDEFVLLQDHFWQDAFSHNSQVAPNYTNWTGARVDYILERGFIQILSSFVYHKSASDHIPVIVDIYNNIHEKKILSINENVENLNLHLSKIGFNLKMGELYNGQLCDDLDWFNLSLSTNDKLVLGNDREFKDPRTIGNSNFNTTLGINGIYLTTLNSVAQYYGATFATNLKQKKFAIFCFKFVDDIDSYNVSVYNCQYDCGNSLNDDNYDIIVNTHYRDDVLKITPKRYKNGIVPFIKLIRIEIYELNSQLSIDTIPTNDTYSHNKLIPIPITYPLNQSILELINTILKNSMNIPITNFKKIIDNDNLFNYLVEGKFCSMPLILQNVKKFAQYIKLLTPYDPELIRKFYDKIILYMYSNMNDQLLLYLLNNGINNKDMLLHQLNKLDSIKSIISFFKKPFISNYDMKYIVSLILKSYNQDNLDIIFNLTWNFKYNLDKQTEAIMFTLTSPDTQSLSSLYGGYSKKKYQNKFIKYQTKNKIAHTKF